jgi:hypothetical protein
MHMALGDKQAALPVPIKINQPPFSCVSLTTGVLSELSNEKNVKELSGPLLLFQAN